MVAENRKMHMNDFEKLKRMKEKYSNLTRNVNEEFINIHPIQRGGILTAEAYKALIAYGDGYSLCDNCLQGRIDKIENPPVVDFLRDLADFFKIDNIMPTAAARDSKRIVMSSLRKKFPERKTVVIDSLSHYTTYLSIEINNLKVKEVPNMGEPEYSINLEDYKEIIDKVIKEDGNLPLLVLLTHVDYKYGNYNDPKKVGDICKEFGIPFMLNAAYSGGILPVNCTKNSISFISCSGHKSMAASGPIGLLGFTEDYRNFIMDTSKIYGELSSKTFPNKICNFVGCPPVYGAPLITLMASFPEVVNRTSETMVKEEAKKANFVVDQVKEVEGIQVQGKLPKIHPLTNLKTDCFSRIAKTHPRRGFFLRDEFKERGIIGLAPGISKEMKFNTFGLKWPQVKHFASSFTEILEKYDLK